MERLHPRTLPVWIAVAAVRTGVLGALLVGGAWAIDRSPDWNVGESWLLYAAVGVVVFLFAFRLLVTWLRFRIWRFQVRDDHLYIERGVFTRIKTVVPFVRLQHVDSQRGPLERAAGLATVVVYTAGSRSADVAIPGLTPDRAEELQEELRRLAIESEAADAV